MTESLCRIRSTLGDVEACPEGACPFWEHGGAALESGCGLERLQIELDRPDVAAYLVGLRSALESARSTREREEARRLVAALWPPDLAGR